MRSWACLAGLILLISAPAPAGAQSASDRQAIEQLPARFGQAWGRHDGRALAELMDQDVDFINVGALWLHGRGDFETYHARLLEGRFKDSTLTPLDQRLRFLRPDIALLHWSWRIEGDRDFDGAPRPPRLGLFTMVVEKRAGAWKIIAAQNTNLIAGTAPEEAGITSPITLRQ